MSTATETAPRPVGEKTVDLVKRRVGDPPYVGRHRRRNWRRLAVAFAALVALIGLGCAAPSDDTPALPNPPEQATAQPEKKKQADTYGEGTYALGEDIKAGTYKTTVPADEVNCYWARLNDFDGGLRSIADNGNLSPGAKGRVVVKKSDAGIEFRGGCVWTKK